MEATKTQTEDRLEPVTGDPEEMTPEERRREWIRICRLRQQLKQRKDELKPHVATDIDEGEYDGEIQVNEYPQANDREIYDRVQDGRLDYERFHEMLHIQPKGNAHKYMVSKVGRSPYPVVLKDGERYS